MNILVVGESDSVEESRKKFEARHSVVGTNDYANVQRTAAAYDVIFDFLSEGDRIPVVYGQVQVPFLFLNSVSTTLDELLRPFDGMSGKVAGFNGLPGFFNLPITEVTVRSEAAEKIVRELALKLDMEIRFVADQPGMITARIIFMIINEACFAVEDGTASESDIDLAMKLGTNYPYGPFEWGQRIGMHNVLRVLNRIHRDTGDDRYNVSNVLRLKSLPH